MGPRYCRKRDDGIEKRSGGPLLLPDAQNCVTPAALNVVQKLFSITAGRYWYLDHANGATIQ
jgi:hypothetical protein